MYEPSACLAHMNQVLDMHQNDNLRSALAVIVSTARPMHLQHSSVMQANTLSGPKECPEEMSECPSQSSCKTIVLERIYLIKLSKPSASGSNFTSTSTSPMCYMTHVYTQYTTLKLRVQLYEPSYSHLVQCLQTLVSNSRPYQGYIHHSPLT